MLKLRKEIGEIVDAVYCRGWKQVSGTMPGFAINEISVVEGVNKLEALFSKFGEEIISEDDKQVHGKTMDDFKYPRAKIKNELRTEMRKRLKEMIGEKGILTPILHSRATLYKRG